MDFTVSVALDSYLYLPLQIPTNSRLKFATQTPPKRREVYPPPATTKLPTKIHVLYPYTARLHLETLLHLHIISPGLLFHLSVRIRPALTSFRSLCSRKRQLPHRTMEREPDLLPGGGSESQEHVTQPLPQPIMAPPGHGFLTTAMHGVCKTCVQIKPIVEFMSRPSTHVFKNCTPCRRKNTLVRAFHLVDICVPF